MKNLAVKLTILISQFAIEQIHQLGRAIAQAVSRRLPIAAARVQTRVWSFMWDFVMDKNGAGAGFLREFRFPLPIYIPSFFSTIIFTITRGWHNMPGVAAVPIASQAKKK
jgi:hypothetical protein